MYIHKLQNENNSQISFKGVNAVISSRARKTLAKKAVDTFYRSENLPELKRNLPEVPLFLSKLYRAISLPFDKRKHLNALKKLNGDFISITNKDGKIIGGFIAAPSAQNTYHIELLFIDRAFQKTGKSIEVLRQIMKTVKTKAQAAGKELISLEVPNGTRHIEKKYRKIGFKFSKNPLEPEDLNYMTAKTSDFGKLV